MDYPVPNSHHKFVCSLILREHRMMLKFGVSEDERRVPQEVLVSVALRFSSPPRAIFTDCLSDTICYSELVKFLEDYAKSAEFHLIEKMAGDFYSFLRTKLPKDVLMALEINKVSPPIKNLQGGVRFSFGDFEFAPSYNLHYPIDHTLL